MSESKKVYIPEPCEATVEEYLNKWRSEEKYFLPEKSLNKLFKETFPNNIKTEEVLIKSSALNVFYNTHIYSSWIVDVAKHISNLPDIDVRLKKGTDTLVSEIAKVKIEDREINFYSFASKYCSHHNPEDFPIYDSFIEKVLMYFKKEHKFAKFKQSDLKDYPTFKMILKEFRAHYGIDSYSLKELDMYLWQLGKEHYGNKNK